MLALLALVVIVGVFVWVGGDLCEFCRDVMLRDQEPDEERPRLDETLTYVAGEYAAEARLKGWQS